MFPVNTIVARRINIYHEEINNNFIIASRAYFLHREPLYPEGHPKRVEQDSQRINTDAPSPTKKKKKIILIGLCMLLVNLLLTHLRIPMIFLFLILKHNLVMNINLVIMLMMTFMLMLNLAIIMM